MNHNYMTIQSENVFRDLVYKLKSSRGLVLCGMFGFDTNQWIVNLEDFEPVNTLNYTKERLTDSPKSYLDAVAVDAPLIIGYYNLEHLLRKFGPERDVMFVY
jgi:hypothetical protein